MTKQNPVKTAYFNMHRRCKSKEKGFKELYLDKGIKVCERWSGRGGYSRFAEDMGERPDGYTLDRIDGSKGYFPENCRWATRAIQSYNTKLHSNNKS